MPKKKIDETEEIQDEELQETLVIEKNKYKIISVRDNFIIIDNNGNGEYIRIENAKSKYKYGEMFEK